MNNKYCVYMHKFPNGKVYIGKTNNPKERWSNGRGYEQKELKRAIARYGWENIEHIILKDDIDEEKILEEENFYIGLYKAYNSRKGYNKLYNNKRYDKYVRVKKSDKIQKRVKKTISFKEDLYKEIEEAANKLYLSVNEYMILATMEKIKGKELW